MNKDESFEEGKGLAYDLRQRYAKIVADNMERITIARQNYNFYIWFQELENLYTVSAHKFKGESEDYNDLKDKVIKLSLKYSFEWERGKGGSPAHIGLILETLRALERCLYKLMDEADMFGATDQDIGL